MKIETVKIADLKPYRYNAKKHPDWHINQIIDSINEFGFNGPIAIDENNRVIEGHGRLKALQKMGRDTVEAIRLVGLTEEQKNAYTLVHNKLTMNTDFDLDTLQQELESILDIDMSIFSFDIDEITQQNEPDWEAPTHEENKEDYDDQRHSILNLNNAMYDGENAAGDLGIPVMRPVPEIPEVKEWIGFNYVMSDPNPAGKGVHFFVDDYQFERVWNRPNDYLEKLSKYAVVIAPDFSPWGDMPAVAQLWNYYRRNWCGRYWQDNGVFCIPLQRSSQNPIVDKHSWDGLPKNSVICLPWVKSWTYSGDEDALPEDGLPFFEEVVKRLSPTKILLYGKKEDWMSKITVPIEEIPQFTERFVDK